MNHIISSSLIKQFKQCPKATEYKYVENLTRKRLYSKPLQRGTWFHALLEAKYKGESVQAVHKQLTAQYNGLMDEEKELLGDLPTEMAELYRAYRWHYRDDKSFKVHETEIKLEADLPNGLQGQGKADALVEDEFGLWAVDHKTHGQLPRIDYRLLDFQSDYYIWLFHQNDIPVSGFIWNYIVPKSPQPLKFSKRNGQLNKVQGWTDYPTALKSAEAVDMVDDPATAAMLSTLKAVRYQRDSPQISPVFRRDLVTFNPIANEQVIEDIVTTSDRYVEWHKGIGNGMIVERNVSRSCDWCEYRNLCVAELIGLDANGIRRREFEVGDPYAYYNDDAGLKD